MTKIVLNGWAASAEAWSLCRTLSFAPDGDAVLFSYLQQLDGAPDAFLESLEGRAVVVGWSMGGSCALRLAMEHPGKIAALVLVAATPRMMEEAVCPGEDMANSPGSRWRGMNERRLAALEAGLRLTHGAGFFGLPEGRPNPYATDTDENLSRGIDYLRGTDLRAGLLDFASSGRASFPVWIFQSRHDGIVRPENAAFLARVFPSATVEMVEGAEHALPVAIPDRIDAAIESASVADSPFLV